MNVPSLARPALLAGVLVLGCVAACVGSDPLREGSSHDVQPAPATNSAGNDAPSLSDGASSSAGDSATAWDSAGSSDAQDGARDGASLSDAEVGPDTPDAPADAVVLVDAGPPSVACTEEPLVAGAFNFRCSASRATLAPGGTLVAGTYLLTRWWDNAACGGGVYFIGWGTVFEQDGERFFRYVRIQKTAAGDVGIKRAGTLWLRPGAAGVIDNTEMCNDATKGTTATGHYEQIAGAATTLTFDFADHQERWNKP